MFPALIPTAHAQLDPQLIPRSGVLAPGCNFITGDIHFHCIPLYLAYLIQLVVACLGTICLVMLIWAGYEWAFSSLEGDAQNAKKRIRNALLGMVLALLSFLIVDTVVTVLFTGPTN